MFGKIVNITLVVMTIIGIPLTVFLVSQRQNVSQQAAVQYNCDINLDRKVDNGDYESLVACLQKESPLCRGAVRLAADLNNDGVVDEKDVNYYLTKCKELYDKGSTT